MVHIASYGLPFPHEEPNSTLFSFEHFAELNWQPQQRRSLPSGLFLILVLLIPLSGRCFVLHFAHRLVLKLPGRIYSRVDCGNLDNSWWRTRKLRQGSARSATASRFPREILLAVRFVFLRSEPGHKNLLLCELLRYSRKTRRLSCCLGSYPTRSLIELSNKLPSHTETAL